MKSDLTAISPFTQNKSVIVENTETGIETRICMDTGYTTNSNYKMDSENITEIEKSTSKLIKDLKYADHELNQYWYLTTAMFSTGMIYPEGTPDSWNWVYAPILEINEHEKEKYPIPGKAGEYYTTRIGTEVSEYYKPLEFQDVCKRVGMAKHAE